MDFLSLEEPEPRRGRGLTRVEAQVVSLLLHLLLALLLIYVPQRLPEPLLAFFRPRPPQQTPSPDAASHPTPRPAPRKIPLEFAYVDPSVRVPNDTPVKDNPQALILSNRNRVARQEVPTPPDARRFSRDPRSEGDTDNRVRPDPSRPEGPESVEPAPGGARAADRGPAADRAAGGSRGIADAGPGPGERARAPASVAGLRAPAGGPEDDPALEAARQLREMLSDVRSGEFKHTFHNMAYLPQGTYGTMSFDTKDFPWGDYDRQVFVAIYNSMRERVPLAAREGLRGYSCLRFVIERDGTISDILLVKPSSVPPFNRAPEDALRAASPLPPLPADFPRDREGATYCFLFNMLWTDGID